MAILALMVYIGGYVIQIGATSPLLFGLLGLVIFVFTCMANWYPPLRKKVNHWLSFGIKNEAVAYARAESTLYALNGLLIVISGFLMITASLYLFP